MKIIMIFFVMCVFFLFNADFTLAEGAEEIKLPAPQTEGGMPLMKALKLRKSTRDNLGPDTKLSMQQISNMLWAANGVNRPGGKRTAPSAIDWRNIDIYVTTADGLFLYDADKHILKVLGRKDVRSVSGQQNFVNEAPVNLIYVADFAKAKGFGGQGGISPSAELWSMAGTGAIFQNVYLWAASEGLACVVRGMVDKDAIRKALKLRKDQHVMLAQTIAHFKK